MSISTIILITSSMVTLFASSSTEEFLKEINATFIYAIDPIVTSTYSKKNGVMEHDGTKMNPKYTQSLWHMETLDNVEHNRSHQELKEMFERLLPYYLRSDNLFSNEELKILKRKKIEIIKYRDFFLTLYLYIGYLESHPSESNRQKLYILVEKSLRDAHSLMENSNEFIDYLMSVFIYKSIYDRLSSPSTLLQKILQKYKPFSSDIFFDKLEKRKQNEYDYIKNNPPQGMENREFFKQFLVKYREYNEIFYQKSIDTIKDGSDEAIQAYRDFRINEEKKNLTKWNAFKFWLSSYLSKGISFFYTDNRYFGNMPEFMAMFLTTSLMSPSPSVLGRTYNEHKAVNQQYENLIVKECKK